MHRRARGLSLVEVVISLAIVGGLFASTMAGVGAVGRAGIIADERVRASQYAADLVSEIQAQPYEDPALAAGSFGLSAADSAGPGRSKYDDVDDYNGYTESPLTDRSGAVIPRTTGWTRSVTVGWARPANPDGLANSDSRIKKIVVTIQRRGRILAQFSGLRAAAWESEWR